MAVNLAGPYEIDFVLTGFISPVREHRFRQSVIAVGSPLAGALPTTIDIQKMGGGTGKLNVVANQVWEFIRLFYSSSITCSGYTLWKYVSGTSGKDFVSAGTVTNPACSGSAGVVASQATLTYRTANGGIMKNVLLESNQAGDGRVTLVPNAAGTPYQKLAAYVMSADNIFFGRDDSFPVAALRASFGQNESVWRKVYRGN